MSIPKRPRQQMINLMYLVLTALLALNVSSEILNAFSLVNKGLDETNASIEKKTDWTYNILQSTRDEATPLQLEYINRSLEARDIATALNVELDRVIELIEEESGGYTDEGKLKKEDNLDIASRVMISNGEGLVLQKRINETTDLFLALVDEEDRPDFEIPLAAIDPVDDEHNRDWTAANFEMTPTVASITILKQLQNDLKTTESNVINYLLDEVRLDGIPINALTAQVSSGSNYVLQGEPYTATILAAGYNSQQSQKVYIGKLDESIIATSENGDYEKTEEFPLMEGFDTYETQAGKFHFEELAMTAGRHTVEGAIEIEDKRGNVAYYPFKETYQVTTSSAVVSPDLMNILWIGVDNPLSISAPGITSDRMSASISGGTLAYHGGDSYTAVVDQPGKVQVNVSAEMDDGGYRSMGAMEFKAKYVPKPTASVNSKTGGNVKKGDLKNALGITLDLDFIVPFKYDVVSYDFYLGQGEGGLAKSLDNSGPAFPQKIKDIISTGKEGNTVHIENIKVKGQDGRKFYVPPLYFTLVE